MKTSCIHVILYVVAISIAIAALLTTIFLYHELTKSDTNVTHFQGEHIPLSRKSGNVTSRTSNRTNLAARIYATTEIPETQTTAEWPSWYFVETINNTGRTLHRVNNNILEKVRQDWNSHYPTGKLDRTTAFLIYQSIRQNQTDSDLLRTQFLSKETLRRIRLDDTLQSDYFHNRTKTLLPAPIS